MMRNFITDDDLKIRHPNIAKSLWSTQTDFSFQIAKGFDRLMNDLHNTSINPRKIMIPMDLLAPINQDANQKLTITTATTNTNYTPHGGSFEPLVGWGQYGLPYVSGPGQFLQEYYQNVYVNLNQRRFIANVLSVPTGSWNIKLQGNNVQNSPDNTGVPDANDPNWEDVTGALITVGDAGSTGEQSVIFYDQFRWYRCRVEGTGSLQFTSSTVENIFDDCIVAAAMIYIYRDWIKEDGDQWAIRLKFAEDEYKLALETIHFMFDLNDSGIVNTDMEEKRSGTITFVR